MHSPNPIKSFNHRSQAASTQLLSSIFTSLPQWHRPAVQNSSGEPSTDLATAIRKLVVNYALSSHFSRTLTDTVVSRKTKPWWPVC